MDEATSSGCTDAKDLINSDLFGTWTLELQSDAGVSISTRLTLQRNPEFAESLAGSFMQGAIAHSVFGDIENSVLDLEESNNGKDIIAIWRGAVVGSCGKAITGSRRIVGTQHKQNFILRRTGW